MEYSSSSGRKIKQTRPFYEDLQTYHFLFFIEAERKYIILSNHSRLFPQSLDYRTVKSKDVFLFRDCDIEFYATYISHSASVDELSIKKDLLSRKLDASLSEVNLSFLNSTKNTQECDIDSVAERDSDSDADSAPINQQASSSVTRETCINTTESNDKLIKEMRKNTSVQYKILDQIKQMNRSLKSIKSKSIPKEEVVDPVDPFVYDGKDLMKIGSKNLDVPRYCILLSRQLWSDAELKNKSLFPKKCNSKPPLSPVRSNIFRSAVKRRFCIDEDDDDNLRCGIAAVNQLTSDISRGKRCKKVANVEFS